MISLPQPAGGPRRIAVALGSNLGDRTANLRFAAGRLRTVLDELAVSPFVESAPEGGADQPRYLNAAAVGRSDADPGELLAHFLAIERAAGRERPFPRAPRTLDVDLILAGGLVIRRPHLEVPHPRFRGRRFVLEPLSAVAPDLVDPVTGRTVAELLAALGSAGGVQDRESRRSTPQRPVPRAAK